MDHGQQLSARKPNTEEDYQHLQIEQEILRADMQDLQTQRDTLR